MLLLSRQYDKVKVNFFPSFVNESQIGFKKAAIPTTVVKIATVFDYWLTLTNMDQVT